MTEEHMLAFVLVFTVTGLALIAAIETWWKRRRARRAADTQRIDAFLRGSWL